MATVRENLIAAKALIDTPEKWVKSDSEIGDCRCAALACDKLAESFVQRGDAVSDMWQALYAELPASFKTDDDEHGVCIGQYNDDQTTTHAEVMALFDRAIAAQAQP